MAVDPNSILAITQPNLEIRRISHINPIDIESEIGVEVARDRSNNANAETITGLVTPYVEIDNYIVPQDRLVSLSINQSGFLPELTLSFMDTTGVFSGMYFPRTNPILKLYIKALSPALKPIRSDYLITNIVSSELSTLYTGEGRIESIYTITAKLYVPGIYGNTVQSIPNKKSWEALKQLADHLKLGFATNETSTDDAMTWINPNGTIENFIQDICSRAYKNEKSFFGCFIDTNYILNFVNYEKALSKETKIMQTVGDGNESQYSATNSINKTESKDDKPKETLLIDVLLSSSIKDNRTGFHIAHYAMYSNHGEVLSKQSFRKSIMWHDRNFYLQNKQPINHYIEPLSEKTIDSKDTIYQKPRLSTFSKEQTTRWVGVDYNNGHGNYKFARLLNSHNIDELGKNYLVVKLPGVTQAIYRGGKVDVMIKRLASSEIDAIAPDSKFGQPDNAILGAEEVTDVYLTGPYVVKDIIYEFNGSPESSEFKYSTELVLVRREWIEISNDNKLESEKNI
jgi:hypothetical protein